VYWLWQSLGAILVIAALSDVFQTIFHPTERGTIGDMVARTIWRVFRRLAHIHRPLLSWAGPLAVLSIMLMWTTLLITGFALIYWPRMDTGFSYANPADLGKRHTFFDAVDLSLDSVITMTGDISPSNSTLRLLMGLEAAFGFGILTASISWLLSIYPILERRRSLGHSATLLRDAEREAHGLAPGFAREMFSTYAQQLITLRSDFMHFPVAFYFHEHRERAGLSSSFSILREFSDWAQQQPDPDLRMTGSLLRRALDDVLRLVTEYAAVPFEDTDHAIGELAREHLRDGDEPDQGEAA